ncbi:hypothetical protein [Metabacillus idriensis]|uniref:hypothetical protein n=1 Tax=Metabacillus idriensis TaxID=324768 RepID=UPI00174DDDFC|nr:hypothetical protein [Metabacillus idriensis]
MNKRYLSITLGVSLVISLVSNFAFYDLWQQEKDKVSELQQELKEANKQIEALNSNHEQEINKVAADFVERLFTYDPRVYENGREAALEMAIGEAKEKLVQQQRENLEGEFNEQDKEVVSLVNIIDSTYNKTGNDIAQATVSFGQEYVIESARAKTINKIKIWLKYYEKRWKVSNFKIIESI